MPVYVRRHKPMPDRIWGRSGTCQEKASRDSLVCHYNKNAWLGRWLHCVRSFLSAPVFTKYHWGWLIMTKNLHWDRVAPGGKGILSINFLTLPAIASSRWFELWQCSMSGFNSAWKWILMISRPIVLRRPRYAAPSSNIWNNESSNRNKLREIITYKSCHSSEVFIVYS